MMNFSVIIHCSNRKFAIQKKSICLDSKASLQALSSFTITSSLVLQCWLALQNLLQYSVVELLWVPGHSGVEGNEKADGLTMMGSDSQFLGPELCLALPTTVDKTEIRDWVTQSLVYSTIQENCIVLPGTFKNSAADGSVFDY
jgi:RNase H